ncbi:MAG: glycosyltransferase [Candidatus Ozemobacteraceae bacterium]
MSVIAHLTNYLPGYHTHAGGAEWAAWRTFRALAEEGLGTLVLTLPFDGPQSPSDSSSRVPGLSVEPLPVVEAYFPENIRRYAEAVKWYSLQCDPLAMRTFEKLLDCRDIRAVHAYNAQFLTLGLLDAAKRRGLPTAMTIYDYWLFCPLTTLVDADNRLCRRRHGKSCLACLPPLFRPIQSILLKRRAAVFSQLSSLIDRFVVLSNASKRLLEDFHISAERITVIPPPLNVQDFSPDATEIEPGLIIFAGWLQRRKGPDVLLRAFYILAGRQKNAHIEIHGMPVKWEDTVAADVRRLAADPRFAGRITLFDKPDRAKLQKRIREAAIIVIPEQWENMSPILLLEARLMGKLVVASRIGGIPEFVRDGEDGLLFRRDDPDDLARVMELALTDPALSERARRLSPQFTRDQLAPEKISHSLATFNRDLFTNPTSPIASFFRPPSPT